MQNGTFFSPMFLLMAIDALTASSIALDTAAVACPGTIGLDNKPIVFYSAYVGNIL